MVDNVKTNVGVLTPFFDPPNSLAGDSTVKPVSRVPSASPE